MLSEPEAEPAPSNNSEGRKPSGPGVGLILLVTILIGLAAAPAAFYPGWGWVVPATLFLLMVLFVFRQLLWLICKSVLTGQGMPKFVRTNENGERVMNCLRCGKPAVLKELGPKQWQQDCPHCGAKETMTEREIA